MRGPASSYTGPAPGLGDRFFNRLGREVLLREDFFPKTFLRSTVVNANIGLALRRESSKGSVWRPLAEIALSDCLNTEVDPGQVGGWLGQYVMHNRRTHFDAKFWFLVPGDWDIRPLELDDHPTYKRMTDLVSCPDYRKSKSYKEAVRQYRTGTLPKRLAKAVKDLGSIDGYFEHCRILANLMKQSQAVPNFGASDTDRHVGVAIGRHGQLLHFQKGHHRMALAKLLGCRRMEAKVLAIHPLWVKHVVRNTELRPVTAIAQGIAHLAG